MSKLTPSVVGLNQLHAFPEGSQLRVLCEKTAEQSVKPVLVNWIIKICNYVENIRRKSGTHEFHFKFHFSEIQTLSKVQTLVICYT